MQISSFVRISNLSKNDKELTPDTYDNLLDESSKGAILWFRRAVSSVVVVSYLMLMMGQSYAMKSSSVVPCDGDVELGNSSLVGKHQVLPFAANQGGGKESHDDDQMTDSTGHSPDSTPEKERGESLDTDIRSSGLADNLFGVKVDELRDGHLFHNKVMPAVGFGVDLEAGEGGNYPDHLSEQSEDDESPDIRAKKDKLLKKTDDFLTDVMRENITATDMALTVVPLVLALLVGYGVKFNLWGELYGETRLQIDTSFVTYALTEEGYRYNYMNPNTAQTKETIIESLTYNNYIALTPYLIARISAFFQYHHQSFFGKAQTTHINPFIRGAGVFAAGLSAIAVGGSVAAQFYSANINFVGENVLYAKMLTPYLFSLYTIDSFLRYSKFKDRIYQYFFVTRTDDEKTKRARHSILDKLRASKAVIASMSDKELLASDLKKKVAGSDPIAERLVGLDALQHLIDIGKDSMKRRFSVKVQEHNYVTTKQFNVYAFIQKKWPLILGTLLAVSGAYLSYNGAKSNFDNAMQMKFPDRFGLPDFSDMGIGAYQEFALTGYKVWKEDTQDIVVYNGNGTDWCTQCRESTKYSNGNMVDGGDFIFTNCPGVGSNEQPFSAPGDWDYTEEKCFVWYDLFDHYLAAQAGVTTDDYYAPADINSLKLADAQTASSVMGALILATVSGAFAALSMSDVIKRVKDAFSDQPEDILSGKRNKWVNGAVLSVAGVESFIRAIPAGVAGWYFMQAQTTNIAILWMVVGLTLLSNAMNFFCDFDSVYSSILGTARKGWEYAVNGVYYLCGNETVYRDAHVVCDSHIDHINQVMQMVENAPVDVVNVLNDDIK